MGKKQRDDKKLPTDHFDPLLVESKQAETVVLMLDSPEEDVLIRAAEAIYKFVDKSDDNKKVVFELNSIDRLMKLMHHDSRYVRRNSTMALGSMTFNKAVRQYLRKTDDIFHILNTLLQPDETTLVHEFALLALNNLSSEYSAKVKIYEEPGCFFNILRLLAENDPDVQKNGIETVNKLLLDYEAKSLIREEKDGVNGLALVIELIYSDFPIIQYLAFSALERATQDQSNRAVLRDVEAIDKLVNIIGTVALKDVHVLALKVLANCMEDSKNIEYMKETGGLVKLLSFIVDKMPDEAEMGAKADKNKKDKGAKKAAEKKGKDKRGTSPDKAGGFGLPMDALVETEPVVKQNAAMALARCAKNPDNRLILNECHVEKTLILLLERPEAPVQTAAAYAIAIMAERMASRLSLGELEGIQGLVRLLHSDVAEVREASSYALANASLKATGNCNEIIRSGGVEHLIRLLADAWATTVTNACSCLSNMANDESVRKQVTAAGLIEHVADALRNEDLSAQAAAALTTAAYVVDGDSRRKFTEIGACAPLVQLLRSPSADVRRNACWALTVCSVDPATTMEICRLGGLDIVAQINQSSSRRNRFSQCALDRLLDTNLSIKYAINDKLPATAFIADGFFDMGRMKFDGTFYNLEQLVNAPVNDKRAIILVNPQVASAEPVQEVVEEERKEKQEKKKPAGDKKKKVASSKKGKRKEERESSDEEAEVVTKVDEEKEKRRQGVPTDHMLHRYIEECKASIGPLSTTWEQVIALAQFVSDRMGGAIDAGEIMNFNWELPLAELKFEMSSNVIPLGMIKKGFFCHRALLFKVIADRIGISCTLVRGDFNRAWNELLLCEDEQDMYLIRVGGIPRVPPVRYVVDLVYQPGHLMRADSLDAINYSKV